MGYADAQFATAGLGMARVVHTGTQHIEFEFADAAFHSEKQTVSRTARIVDAAQIDDPRLDKTALFKQMMPVPSVARQTRRIQTQNRPDLSGTEPPDKPLEAGPGHRSTRRAAKVVVDDFDIAKSTALRFLNKLVLTTLALEVHLDLRLGRLADINNRLAFE